MDMIAHSFKATNIGVLFTVRSPIKLSDLVVIKAIKQEWRRMTDRDRKRAIRGARYRIDLTSLEAQKLTSSKFKTEGSK